LQAEEDGDGENQDEPTEAAIFRQVHEKEKGHATFDDGDGQHADEHLIGAEILISDHELETGQNQQANIDSYISSDSNSFVRFGCSHGSSS
jgi:hypothetical protein